ncbi:unnamed protein product [Schistosoma turkestanicum]|nr:unnamed protein product [Schistosoma turkestanicum]
MIKYSLIITAYISLYLFNCYHTQTNATNASTVLSPCEACPTCNANMRCNYSEWISQLGKPEQLIEKYRLKSMTTKSSCLNECISYPLCNLFTYEVDTPQMCDLYSGPIGNFTMSINSSNFMTGRRVCCSKFKPCLQ